MVEENHCPECGAKLSADAPQGQCPKCLMKLGLPTGVEVDKTAQSKPTIDIPPSHTPPGGFVPPEPSKLAGQFPQLEIIELLGQGGMGAVYKARQKQLDRLVALKILPPEIGQTEAFAERFTREARSLAKLSHPRIVSVYDFGHTEEGLYFFLMEFIDGTDLRRLIQSGSLSADEALAIVPQVCEALQFAHEEGIVHRDVKPENILLDKKGRVKIADFGLAKLLDRPATIYTLTQAGQRMGTPHYMAPEQIEHPGQVDHRADIYSLGVVFYEMLTGELPLGRFDLPSQKVQVDVRLDKVVLHSLEKEPERRYQHASEVKTDVETISSEPKVPVQHPSSTPAPVQRRLSRAAIVGACWAPLFFLMLFPVALFFVPVQRVSSTGSGPSVSVPGVSVSESGVSVEELGVSAPGVSIEVPSISVSGYGVSVPGPSVEEPGVSVSVPSVSVSAPRGVPMIGLGLIIVPFLLGFSSVFGTTILGFVSISHIRHSAGRLYGMGLAVFDALLFPLLFLDVVIMACSLFMFRIISVPLFPGMSSLYLAVAICIILDFLIIHWAWRKANKGLVPINPLTAVGAIPSMAPAEQHPYMQTGRPGIGSPTVWPDRSPEKSGSALGAITPVNPMEKHITLVAVLNIVFGTIGIIVGFIVFAAISGGGLISEDPTAIRVTGIVGPAVGFFFVLTSVPELIGGIGLLKRRGWARILVIIIAVLGLMEIPFGTAISIYTLWVLLNEKTARLFTQASTR